MKRLITLCAIVAAIAIVAAPAFAEVQNVKVSGDIDSKMIYRADYDFLADTSNTYDTKDNDVWFMTTTRVRIDADLTDNVSTVVRLINERDWDEETCTASSTNASDSGNTDIDLDLAYVVLKECFYFPLTLMIGRQNLKFGNALVVGDPYTNDTEGTARLAADDLSNIKAFDAIRATLDYSPTVVDLIYAKIDADQILRAGTRAIGEPRDDMDLWGINVAYDFNNDYNAVAEAYAFSRRDRRNFVATAELAGEDVCNVWGVNANLEPLSDLLLSGELAYQNGDYLDTGTSPDRTVDRDAWAFDIGVTYDGFSEAIDVLPGLSLRAAYIYRSGQDAVDLDSDDDDISDTATEFNAWDPMYEDQTHGIVANYIFDGVNDGVDSNGRTVNIGASAEPLEDLTVSVDYYLYRLDKKYASDNSANENRSLNDLSYAVKDDKELGSELDLVLNYAYTEDVTMGLACGWFFPGGAFDNNKTSAPTNNDTATSIIASVDVAF